MNDPLAFYNLYCINKDCEISIYRNSAQTRVIFNEENLVTTHFCECCGHLLSSAMDVEIEQMAAEVGVILSKPHYKSSH
jgi:hypothetical protein